MIYERTKRWFKLYRNKEISKPSESNTISKEKLDLIKFFITSNLALMQLENVHLRACFKDEIKIREALRALLFKYECEKLNNLNIIRC
jgi:hypothetical protein